MTDVNVFLFEDYETLDAFGPIEILGKMEAVYRIRLFSAAGGPVCSRQGTKSVTVPAADIGSGGILLIPGGQGTRALVHDRDCISMLRGLADAAETCMTVCTGSALLAVTGLLDGAKATSNKRAFDWVRSLNERVCWEKKARWVTQGKFYTSSGVSAGMDMALGFVRVRHGEAAAREIADRIEYRWNDDPAEDPFSGMC
jgi:putative intracellular protease/amidase